MGNDSVVSGYIKIFDKQRQWNSGGREQTQQIINSYAYDEVWPFTNIFWCDSPAQYFSPVVGFAGSYKQIEEVWSEWMWKFGGLLSKLDAMEARVHLSCVMGNHSWELHPEVYCTRTGWPTTMAGQQWVITAAPEQDFSIDPTWLRWVENQISTQDTATGEFKPYKWDKFLERRSVAWLQE